MQRLFLIITIFTVALSCLIYTDSLEARGMPAVNLNLIPTAETLGKGGYIFSVGMYPYDIAKQSVEAQTIDVGGFFKEKHDLKIESDIWLIPSRITFGLTERLDLTFGGTYSAGDTDKIVSDYFETSDEDKERVYSQVVVDGMIGLKYRIKKSSASIPDMAVGGEVQMGYTVDNELVDDTLEDSMPFIGMQIYMAGSYDFDIVNVHGGLGMYLSSKSIQSDKRFDIPINIGAEIPFDGFAAVVDLTLFKAFSGIGLDNVVSAGLRYDISSNSTINAAVSSVGGFLVRLSIGGKKPVAAAPPSAPTLF
ncbi:hypothetical protein GF312_01465 [Candidatus Poribacteria bacterium]|nr:hypothetical protein [Candidatus Poribacteria bacterium]